MGIVHLACLPNASWLHDKIRFPDCRLIGIPVGQKMRNVSRSGAQRAIILSLTAVSLSEYELKYHKD